MPAQYYGRSFKVLNECTSILSTFDIIYDQYIKPNHNTHYDSGNY